MTKYKLIKKFPGSMPIGSVYGDDYQNGITDRYQYANEPDYFEEIKEQQFKIGDWIVGENNIIGRLKEWGSSSYCYFDDGLQPFKHLLTRLATTEEIKKHLLAEAEKKGFKEGVKFKGVTHPKGKNGFQVTCNEVFFNAIHSYNLGCYLYSNNEYIYLDGQWAEIIKEESIEIAGYKANFEGDTVAFGCRAYSKNQIFHLLDDMDVFRAISVNIEGAGTVDIGTIKKIYDRIKK